MVIERPKVEFDRITVSYGGKIALKEVTFDVKRNEILGIIGPAGSGKTTLLRVLNRTLELTTGSTRTASVMIPEMSDVPNFRKSTNRPRPKRP